jgi:hypothetical protein
MISFFLDAIAINEIKENNYDLNVMERKYYMFVGTGK